MREHKTIKFEVKSFDDETGEFEGTASAYRKTPDRVRDIVDPGAFTKTIAEWDAPIPLTYPPHVIGSVVGGSIVIDDAGTGLHVKGTLLRGIQKAEEAYQLMKAGIIKHLSIGYDAIKWEMKGTTRHLKEVALHEIGLVPGKLAADDQAIITSVKADFDNRLTELENEIKEGRVVSRANLQRIKNAINALQDLLENAHLDEDDEPAGKPAPEKALPSEPSSDTPHDEEAAKISGLLAKFQSGFNEQKIEARIDELLLLITQQKIK